MELKAAVRSIPGTVQETNENPPILPPSPPLRGSSENDEVDADGNAPARDRNGKVSSCVGTTSVA